MSLFRRKAGTDEVPAGPPIENRMDRWWHPETFVCAFSGHVTPTIEAKQVSPQDSLLALNLQDGGHIARCIRCDAWLIADPKFQHLDTAPHLDDVEIPQRGKDLRDALILKLIAIDRAIHAFVFGVVAVAVFFIETHLGGLQDQARRWLSNGTGALSHTGQDASRSFVAREIDRFSHLHRDSLKLLMFTAIVYCVVEGIEAVGLWRGKRWAEYLTALATAGFLPFEIYELTEKITIIRIGALILNLIVLVYLLFAKRLFGIRGGIREDEKLLRLAEMVQPLPGQPMLVTESEKSVLPPANL